MFPYFETLACRDGIIYNVEAHAARCLKTIQDCTEGGTLPSWFANPEVPSANHTGLFRIKLQYDGFDWQVDWYPYHRQQPTQLMFREVGDFQYPYKLSDRAYFETCLQEAGSEIWFHRQGTLLDTTYTHVAIWLDNTWQTPQTWLLPSTKRTWLLRLGLIRETVLKRSDLPSEGYLILYNAMRDWEDLYRFKPIENGLQLQREDDEKILMNLRRFRK